MPDEEIAETIARDKKIVEREIGAVPSGLYVWYCPVCKYTVTFDNPTMASYESSWSEITAEAMQHDH